jgi:mannitol-1-phosphate/altronate dehydrogenase
VSCGSSKSEYRKDKANRYMLHLHFGAGRLGLGLVAPAFQAPGSELIILNRAVSSTNATGVTALSPKRRNELLQSNPDQVYYIQKPGGSDEDLQVVRYDAFLTYDEQEVGPVIRSVAETSRAKERGVIVSASILKPENYSSVISALAVLSGMKEVGEPIGRIFFIACENTLTAQEVFQDQALFGLITPAIRRSVTPVAALVDRLCVGLEEVTCGSTATVQVCAEEYASLKLELRSDTQALIELCAGSQIEFSRHLEVEKQIKSWLVNGSHWLIALQAFQASRGDRNLKLNEFICSSPEQRGFAESVMAEMREGVALVLRSNPRYAAFAEDVDVDDYLEGAARAILRRFYATEDPITRILARFQAPSSEAYTSIEAFTKRFADRINEPVNAYTSKKGFVPPATSRGLLSLLHLVASGTFIDAPAS